MDKGSYPGIGLLGALASNLPFDLHSLNFKAEIQNAGKKTNLWIGIDEVKGILLYYLMLRIKSSL